jgi:hypothetical protein
MRRHTVLEGEAPENSGSDARSRREEGAKDEKNETLWLPPPTLSSKARLSFVSSLSFSERTRNMRNSSVENAGSSTLNTASPAGDGCRRGGADILLKGTRGRTNSREREIETEGESAHSAGKSERACSGKTLFSPFFSFSLSLSLSNSLLVFSLSIVAREGGEGPQSKRVVKIMNRFLAAA